MTAGFVGAVMAVVAGVVLGAGDRRILVSPPEAVVESFLRALERGRLPQARKYLSDGARRETSIDRLREAKARLDSRTGDVLDVKGEGASISGDAAEAAAIVRTRTGGEVRFAVRLRREAGEWRVREVEGVLP